MYHFKNTTNNGYCQNTSTKRERMIYTTKMIKVAVGSKNPAKLAAVQEAFEQVFPDEAFEYLICEAASGVPDQPFGSKETKQGATNRAHDCRRYHPDADFFVGLEGGLEEDDNTFWTTAWMCVVGSDGVCGHGKTCAFPLPLEMSRLIREGVELGTAADQVFSEVNSKHSTGTVGLLTNGLVKRKDFYRDALIFALIPFVQRHLYTKDER
jgi:inosine/xanthosine triphosphatase